MTSPPQETEPLSLWECLHDGVLVSFESDLMARSLTAVVDSAYHWDFHHLPADTRFRIVGENVRIAETFGFEAWAGAIEPSRDTPWDEAEEQRRNDREKGRLISSDWQAFITEVESEEEYIVLQAKLTNSQPLAVLELEAYGYPNSNYQTVRIHAERFRFEIGERELSLESFLEFGAAYWADFAQRSKALSEQREAV